MNMKKWLAGSLAVLMLLTPSLPVRTYADTTLLELAILQQAHAAAAELPESVPELPETTASGIPSTPNCRMRSS